jgi:hypothetical protein
MDRQASAQVWREICFLLSDSIKANILEKDYENQIVRALETLGWKEFTGEIRRQPELKIGSNTKLRPDVVIYNQKNEPIIVVEVKRPSEQLSKKHEPADQLSSYMLQLKAEFGLLIGTRIGFYYDGKENQRRHPLLLQNIDFDENSKAGVQFVEIFNRSNFLKKQYNHLIKILINNFTAGRNIRKLRDILVNEETVAKIIGFLREDFSDYGSDVVEGALNGLKIELSYDSGPISLEKTDDESKGLPESITDDESKGLLETILDTIKRYNNGISKKELINITGFGPRQISNAIYKLKKRRAIVDIDRGVYKAIKAKVPPITKPKPQIELQKGTLIYDLYKLIRKRKSGFTLDEIRAETGVVDRQLSNALYKLTKRGYIQSIERGRYQALF